MEKHIERNPGGRHRGRTCSLCCRLSSYGLADGPMALGAVLLRLEGDRAVSAERVS